MRKKLVVMAVAFSLCCSGVSASASTKTAYYGVVDSQTITIKGITKKPSGVDTKKIKIVKVSKKGLRLKGVAEGVTSFNFKGCKYKIHIIPNNIPKKIYSKVLKPKVRSNVYYTVRETKSKSGFITVYNNNNYAVDIKYKHSDYKTKTKLFETRTSDITSLAPHTSYTFSDYTSMPYYKRDIEITKSDKECRSKDDVYVNIGNTHNSNSTSICLVNHLDHIVKVKLFIMKLDDEGQVYSYGEEGFAVPDASTVWGSTQNNGIVPSKVLLVDYNVYER